MKPRLLAVLAITILSLAAAPVPPATTPATAPIHPAAIPIDQIGKTVTGAPALAASAKKYDAKALGAKGDGTTKDTAALQKILDDCAAGGGGEVTLPIHVLVDGQEQPDASVHLVDDHREHTVEVTVGRTALE